MHRSKYRIPVTLTISCLRSCMNEANRLMLSICKHGSEKSAVGFTGGCERWRPPGSGSGWATRYHVRSLRPVSCSLAVAGTSQPWQKKNIVGLKLVLVLLLLLKWTRSESPSALSLWRALSMCHSPWNPWDSLRQCVLEERTCWHTVRSGADPSPACSLLPFFSPGGAELGHGVV